MKRSIWVLNQKGGTGKSTVSTCIASHLNTLASSVALFDIDCQPDGKSLMTPLDLIAL